MKKYEGKTLDGVKVIGTYCIVNLSGCWIGDKTPSGRWETKVEADTVKEIRDDD